MTGEEGVRAERLRVLWLGRVRVQPSGGAGAGQEPAGGGGFRCLPCRAVRGAPALFGGRKVSQVRPDSAEMSPAASLAGEGGIRMR